MRSIIASFTHFLLLFTLIVPSLARATGGRPERWIQPYKREPLQNIVTWDNSSLMVNGQRIMFYSGEFHPFRLPVPSLWLDVFQKIRSLGYTGVSFYVDWALLEGKPGEFSAKGVFALEPFFEAAKKAGIYLLARPGPYINAEVAGGGFPGWLQRIKGHPRTADPSYLTSTDLYVKSVGAIIAKAQITNGGPVILFQPENEYTIAAPGFDFPDPNYFQYVQDQYRAAGIVVPFMSNDANPGGHNAPGQPAAVDIYGHDGYPLGFDCANPTVWPAGKLPTNWRDKHLKTSPGTPYSIPEFQGGSFDPWGGPGFEQCAALLNPEFQRVFYKNDFSFGVTIFSLYMTFGGTNWGNLGHAGGYTSYDYGAVITEDRSVHREKYSEAKLEANFIVASPSYLTAVPGPARSDAYYTNSKDITVTPLRSGSTQYLVARHTDYASLASTYYRLTLTNTSAGDLNVPLAGGTLTLHGRDSKIHVVDYMMGGINLLYSTAEILTWKRFKGRTTLVVYTGPDEQHEMGISLSSGQTLPTTLLGNGVNAAIVNGVTVVSWRTTAADRALRLGPLDIYFVDRNSAYQHWILEVPGNTTTNTPYTQKSTSHVILKGGYLMRTARISGTTLALTGDLAPTEQLSQTLRIISGAPPKMTRLTFNGQNLAFIQNANGIITAAMTYNEPEFSLPNLVDLPWSYIDSLPEIQPTYSDANWVFADYPKTDNTLRNLTTPTSLYGSDYGYHTGTLLYRGRFKANGNESSLFLNTQGGSAFGMSAWLGSKFLGSFVGFDAATSNNKTFSIPRLSTGREYILTIIVDNMGLDEDFVVGEDQMKSPRGILDFRLSGHAKNDITWKLTGNFGGESYLDKVRGPLNEGGMWAERQGYHLPAPPASRWKKVTGGPMRGIGKAGIAFYTTSFELKMPRGYDIPLSIVFSNVTTTPIDDPPTGTSKPPSNPPPPIAAPPIVVPKPVTPTTNSSDPSMPKKTPPSRPMPPVKPPPEKAPPVIVPPTSTTPTNGTTNGNITFTPLNPVPPAPVPALDLGSSPAKSPEPPAQAPPKELPAPPIPKVSPDVPPLPTRTEPNEAAPKNQSPPQPVTPNQSIPKPVNPKPLPPINQSPPKPVYPDQALPPKPADANRLPPSLPRAKDPSQSTPQAGSPWFVPFGLGQPRPTQTPLSSPNQPLNPNPPRQPFLDPKWPNTQYPGGLEQALQGQANPKLPGSTQAAFPVNQESSSSTEDFESPEFDDRRTRTQQQQSGSQDLPPSPIGNFSHFDPSSNRPPIRTSLTQDTASTMTTSKNPLFSRIDSAEPIPPPDETPPWPAYRIQFFVNGWQFGKYVSNIGPQTKFPVPEGIWNYQGTNTLSMTLWALDGQGARIEDMRLVAGPAILTGMGSVETVESPAWVQRTGVY